MAIVIAYSGTLNDPGQRDWLLEDVRRCSICLGWPCREVSYSVCGFVFARETAGRRPQIVEDHVRGVQLLPPGTEPFLLTFNRAGRLAQYTEVPRQLLADPATVDTYFLESAPWVKTTGQPRTHVVILVLLRRIRAQFMRNLRVEDDSRFWETADYGRLSIAHEVNRAIDPVSGTAEALASLGEDPEIILDPLDRCLPGQLPSRFKTRVMAQPHPA